MDNPDLHIFMMCKAVKQDAFSDLAQDFHIRNCRPEEIELWKQMPFDTDEEWKEYKSFMDDFFQKVYGDQLELFLERTLFVCDATDQPIATCLIWKSYGLFNTIQWLKVKKGYEGKGIGRALLSVLLKEMDSSDFPIYLHTQVGSYRAIKLYSDFGFCLLTDEFVGIRKNELEESLPVLKAYMPAIAFQNLVRCEAPEPFIRMLKEIESIEF